MFDSTEPFAERLALFRHSVIGPLLARSFDHGELAEALRELSRQRFRPPGSPITKTFAPSTLERWYYAFKNDGLDGLRPKRRSDRGLGQNLTEAQRELLLAIRRENPNATTPLIVRTLVADGRLAAGAVSVSTVNRLYRSEGLDRTSLKAGSGKRPRLRWEAEAPGVLWHADVCHGPALTVDGQSRPLRIHALLDDASRFIVAIEARHSEQEVDMLELWVRGLRRWGRPEVLYLDNGSTYRGEALSTACSRLGVNLLHAQPYDPQARGKMERFWRTLRQGCLNHLGDVASLHDVNVRLWAFLEAHYHKAPHASLLGRTPEKRWLELRRTQPVQEDALAEALTVRQRRRIRKDSTVTVNGALYQVDQGFLVGRLVTIAHTLVLDRPPAVHYKDQVYPLHPVDVVHNGKRRRRTPRPPERTVPFDPAGALLDVAVGRRPAHEEEER